MNLIINIAAFLRFNILHQLSDLGAYSCDEYAVLSKLLYAQLVVLNVQVGILENIILRHKMRTPWSRPGSYWQRLEATHYQQIGG